MDDDFVKTGFSRILYGRPQLIPIARELGGGYLVLDDRPEADRGRVHEAEATDGVTRGGHGMWASLPVLMERVATSLETGRPINGYRPEVNEEQRLRWDLTPLRGEGTVRRP